MAYPVWSNLNSRRSTRVLKLLPGQTADPLQIHLHEVNLDDKPSYHAISYTWGEETYTQSVSINGVATDIRRNLFNFLLVLRNQLHTQDLWVDALSIRQDDLDRERKPGPDDWRDIQECPQSLDVGRRKRG